jgi:hypothetical protein
MVASQMYDGETTRRAINATTPGGVYVFEERNIFMDDHPSNDEIWFSRAAVVGLLWGLGEIFPDGREMFFTIGIGSGVVAGIHNDHIYRHHHRE